MTHKARLDDNSKGPGVPWPDTGSLLYYSTWSKSTSSITAELEQEARWRLRCAELQKIRDQAKQIEEQWRHDLAKWRSHRWSVSSNFVRERREQERAELAGGGNAGKFNTCSKMQGGESRDTDNPGCTGAASLQTPQAATSKLQPRSTSLPPRSYPVDSAYGSVKRAVTPPTTPVLLRTSPEASISNRICSRTSIVCADQTKTTLKQRTSTSAVRTVPQQTSINRTSTSFATVTSTALTGRTSTSLPDLPGRFPANPRGTTVVVHSGASSAYKALDTGLPIGRPEQVKSLGPLHSLHSMDTKPAATQVTTSLPRSSWRSDSSRLASVVSPRPFGTQSTRIAPVSRVFTMDDSQGPFNGEKNPSHNSTVLDHQHLCPSPGNGAQSQPRSILKIKKDTEAFPSPHSPLPFPPMNCQSRLASTAAEASDPQTRYETIRIRLTCTKSSLDFGFQISRHSGGIFIESIQQGSPAELCQLHVGDEIVALDGHRASEMSGDQWKASLDSALQHNNLVLDIKRMAQNGSSKEYINFSNESISQPPLETAVKSTNKVNSQAISDVEGMNGEFHHESLDSKGPKVLKTQEESNNPKARVGHIDHGSFSYSESKSLSLKNLKRRSEFFEQQGAPGLSVSSLVYLCGGSESAIPDLSIPSIAASSTRHSWDLKEERKRHEKWQQEQERLLQEKYKRDQQKLEDEWRQAQKDALREGSGNLAQICGMDRNSEGTQPQGHLEGDRSFSAVSSTSTPSRATPPPSEEPGHPEDGEESREMGEILLQGPGPDNEALEIKEETEVLGLQRNGEKVGQQLRLNEKEDSPLRQQAADTCPAEAFDLHEQDLRRGNGFAEFSPEMSLSDRAKSQSTPELDEAEKPEVTGSVANSSSASKPIIPENQEPQEKKKTKNNKKKGRPLSQVELDRLQILEEMKKRTPLLTDTSWIRQRSTNIYKEPIHLGGGMRRYESLDNLNSARSWKQSLQPACHVASTSSSDRPNSALSNCASSLSYTRSLSSTLPTSFSMGSLRQSPWSQPSPSSPTPNTPLSEESAPEPHPTTQHSNSASTASLTSGDQSLELEPELKSDCETGNSTASSSTPNSQMDCPSPCDLTTLLQDEDETTLEKDV